MNAKTSLLGLCGMLLVSLSGCAFRTAEMIQEHERQVVELRRQVDQLKMQIKARDEETKRVAQELEKAKKLEAQVLALEERLRLMDDVVLAKSEELARLEGQLEAAKEAGAAKGAPAKKAKPNGGAQSKQAP